MTPWALAGGRLPDPYVGHITTCLAAEQISEVSADFSQAEPAFPAGLGQSWWQGLQPSSSGAGGCREGGEGPLLMKSLSEDLGGPQQQPPAQPHS